MLPLVTDRQVREQADYELEWLANKQHSIMHVGGDWKQANWGTQPASKLQQLHGKS